MTRRMRCLQSDSGSTASWPMNGRPGRSRWGDAAQLRGLALLPLPPPRRELQCSPLPLHLSFGWPQEGQVVVTPDPEAKQAEERQEGGATVRRHSCFPLQVQCDIAAAAAVCHAPAQAQPRQPSCLRAARSAPPLQVVRLPAGQSDQGWRQALAAHADARLLHVSSLEGAFGGFEGPDLAAKFQVRPAALLVLRGQYCSEGCSCGAGPPALTAWRLGTQLLAPGQQPLGARPVRCLPTRAAPAPPPPLPVHAGAPRPHGGLLLLPQGEGGGGWRRAVRAVPPAPTTGRHRRYQRRRQRQWRRWRMTLHNGTCVHSVCFLLFACSPA